MTFHRGGAGPLDLISTLKVEPGSAVAGKSLLELDLRRRYGVTVLVLRKGAQSVSSPSGPDRLETDCAAVVMGSSEQIAGVLEFFRSERGGLIMDRRGSHRLCVDRSPSESGPFLPPDCDSVQYTTDVRRSNSAKRMLKGIGSAFKWLVVGLICIEALSFAAVTAANFILNGHAREGSRAIYDPYTLFLQNGGPRSTAYNSVSADSRKNRVIWLFGGSTMRGWTDSDDKTIASFVSQFLNSGEPTFHVTVKNYGMNSFNSLLETKYLQKLLIESEHHPDIIVFYDGANDAKYYAEHRHPYGHHGFRRVSGLIESYYKSWLGLFKPLNAALYSSFTRELYDKLNQVLVPIDPDSHELRKWVDGVIKRYRHVDKIAECYGASFILFWQPLWWVEECDLQHELKQKEHSLIMRSEKLTATRENFTIPYEALAEKLRHEPYFLNLCDALCRRTTTVYKPDGVHLTDQGRKMMGIRIGHILEKRLQEIDGTVRSEQSSESLHRSRSLSLADGDAGLASGRRHW